jgi:hypothetical protein
MEPIVVTLTKDKALQILLKYIEVSQSKGTYLITEADILKRCFDVLVHFAKDPEISVLKAKELLGQAASKGQAHGDYTLNDASLIFNTLKYLDSGVSLEEVPVKEDADTSVIVGDGTDADDENEDEFDLSELSKPVPLRPKEI